MARSRRSTRAETGDERPRAIDHKIKMSWNTSSTYEPRPTPASVPCRALPSLTDKTDAMHGRSTVVPCENISSAAHSTNIYIHSLRSVDRDKYVP